VKAEKPVFSGFRNKPLNSGKETRIATARREQKAPTLEQIKHVLKVMSARTEIERRNEGPAHS
jgi:hypothetical protein